MKLQILPPPPPIANCVHHIVVMEDCNLQGDFIIPLIAKGYPSIVFQTTDAKVDTIVLYGQNVKPFQLTASGHITIIACFLFPHLLKPFFGFSGKEVMDICIDLSYSEPAKSMGFKNKMIDETSLTKRLQLMDDYVLQLCSRAYCDANKAVSFATYSIQKSNGLVALKSIQDDLQITERTFQRLFENHVGVSPKMFSKICRFNSAFQQLNQSRFFKLSDIAYENGYADQSHFIRIFKEFTNYTPTEYLKNIPVLD
jgi:AraC-like DNA-binding protein